MEKKIKNPNVKIIIATHKKAEMPIDSIYYPLQVGAEINKNLDLKIQKDNIGENISYKNLEFGTQTALYWSWKNINADYKGLVHYRRYFLKKKVSKNEKVLDCILDRDTLNPLLKKYRIFVPKKRKYYIENIYEHYSHTLYDGKNQLEITRRIIEEKTPEYLKSFDNFMKQKSAYIFNMMILENNLMNQYCSWLFEILFELEKRIDTTKYSDFDKRYIGRISERLFNVWLFRKIEIGEILRSEICELSYNEQVNWLKKICTYIRSKFFNQNYKKSF